MSSIRTALAHRTAAFSLFLLTVMPVLAQTSAQKAAVPLNASVQSSPARITLSWTTLPSTTSITIYRKLADATTWGSAIATPAASDLSYADNNVTVGTLYEYKVVRVAAGVTGTGYISSGIAVPPTDYRGRMILLVDNTFSSSLSAELATLVTDLRMDGWAVVRSDLSRTASVASVKSTILSHYNADPQNTKAVFIVGHLAVPYSGNQAPDGHSEHTGAWPCDGYYGELNGTWTDATVNNGGAARAENRNVPGDGKFDQSDFPSALELQVGRVDFFDLPAFSQSETELLRAYLNKVHAYKIRQWAPQQRGLVYDNLQWVSNPLAASAWRSLPPLVGNAETTAAQHLMYEYPQLVHNQSYLWTYFSGGGTQATVNGVLTYNGAARCGTTESWATSVTSGGVFNMSFGSYFGDWDNKNNFLRAVLASGQALTNCWAAIPAWYFHHMGMGANIGHSTLMTMNNTALYTPLTDGWQGSIGRGHLALMGDPSLRQKMLVPPSNLVVSNSGGFASFSWMPSSESVDGYHIYSIDATSGAVTRITTSLLTGTSHTSTTVPYVAGREFMVRAVKLITEPSGSYFNLSLGASAIAAGAVADCNGVVGGTALPGTPCNDGNACTINDALNANCQCVGVPSNPTATITAGSATSFCSGGTVTLTANTGTGLTYQWRRNGTSISGATGSTYTATTSGSYTVVVSNGSCSSTSAATTVTVNAAPSATITAAGPTSFCSGGSVVLSANTGTGLTYQWRKDGAWISGATSSTYTASTSGFYSVIVTSNGCSTTSALLQVTADGALPATITAGGATSFCSGGSVVLSANTGTGLTYQWRNNGANISGATASTYTASASGSYTVVVSNGSCSTTSAATTVTVSAAPAATITAGGSTSFCAGGSVTLSASTGNGLTYQWRNNGTAISGATGSTYAATASGSYTVVVSNGSCSATSAATTVTVSAAPPATITAGGSTSFCTGGSVTLSANTGSGLTYQWRNNGTNISGATASTYTANAAGSYTVVVGNGTCSTTSAATSVTVSTAPAATITAGGSTSFCSGASVTLSANTGTGFTYQWRNNGTTISGATSSSYTATASGNYSVVVSNGGCSATSSAITVTAQAAPSATITAGGATGFCAGGSVVLSANTGTGLSYQWRNNGANISGATSSTYTATAAGSYTVVVGNGTCSTTSAATTVSVGTPPTAAITNGASASFCSGSSVLLTAATATGNTYQWRLNGANISGATASTYSASTAGNYTVVVTSNGCSATSSATSVSSATAPTIACSANAANGTVSASVTGGTGPFSYSWNTVPEQTTATATVQSSGTYTVTVRGANGCPSTCSVAIAVSGGCSEPRTVKQAIWGAPATATNLSGYMAANWAAAFPAPNYLQIGCSGRLVRFTTAQAVIDNLPSTGAVTLLPAGTTVNPSATAVSNTLLGHLAALKISARMDEIDAAFCPSSTLLKNMIIAQGTFAGWTVQQLINHADQAIGGCVAQYPLVTISVALANINNGYAVAGQGSGYLVCPPMGMALDAGEPDDQMEEARIIVFPNPTRGTTSLVLPATTADAPATVELYSATGAWMSTLYQGRAEAGIALKVEWDAQPWPAGAYICRVMLGDVLWHARVIIE